MPHLLGSSATAADPGSCLGLIGLVVCSLHRPHGNRLDRIRLLEVEIVQDLLCFKNRSFKMAIAFIIRMHASTMQKIENPILRGLYVSYSC